MAYSGAVYPLKRIQKKKLLFSALACAWPRPSVNVKRVLATHRVPAKAVLRYVWSSGKNLAKPKSLILGWNLSSRSMLPALLFPPSYCYCY
jgi:hypothetical protein